jgi:hypothetical protein
MSLSRRLYPWRKDNLRLGLGRGRRNLKFGNEGGERGAVNIHDLRLGRLDRPGNPEHTNMKNYNDHDRRKGKVDNIRDFHVILWKVL